MMISRITFSKYSVRQGNTGRMVDIESTIISIRKCKLKQAFSTIKTNPTRKMVYQSTVGLVMVCIIATSSIPQSWNIIESVQVGQITSFFWGKDGLAEARWSKMMEWIPSTPNIVEENVSYSIWGINNWSNII